jgi:uncharacterized damage-inducible protein DinB
MSTGLATPLHALLERDLLKLEEEISQYADETLLWKVDNNIRNPAGNLCLHLCGNLQHYIGRILGHSDYVRDRPKEFASRNIPKAMLIQEIRKTREAVSTTLHKLDAVSLEKLYPEEVLGYPMTTAYFLIHLHGHLNYHLGQINYHRRLIRP